MAGLRNFVPSFYLNPAGIAQNLDAIINGFSGVKRFLWKSIWSPLGAECYSLFMCGFLGLSESQSEVPDPIVFPVFEVERWEEETYLW